MTRETLTQLFYSRPHDERRRGYFVVPRALWPELVKITDAYGQHLVRHEDGEPTLYGRPIQFVETGDVVSFATPA